MSAAWMGSTGGGHQQGDQGAACGLRRAGRGSSQRRGSLLFPALLRTAAHRAQASSFAQAALPGRGVGQRPAPSLHESLVRGAVDTWKGRPAGVLRLREEPADGEGWGFWEQQLSGGLEELAAGSQDCGLTVPIFRGVSGLLS